MALVRNVKLSTEFLLGAQKIQAKALVNLAAEVEKAMPQLRAKPNVRLRRALADAWEALGLATEGSTNDAKRKKNAAQAGYRGCYFHYDAPVSTCRDCQGGGE